jgi:hypothetical protein
MGKDRDNSKVIPILCAFLNDCARLPVIDKENSV